MKFIKAVENLFYGSALVMLASTVNTNDMNPGSPGWKDSTANKKHTTELLGGAAVALAGGLALRGTRALAAHKSNGGEMSQDSRPENLAQAKVKTLKKTMG